MNCSFAKPHLASEDSEAAKSNGGADDIAQLGGSCAMAKRRKTTAVLSGQSASFLAPRYPFSNLE